MLTDGLTSTGISLTFAHFKETNTFALYDKYKHHTTHEGSKATTKINIKAQTAVVAVIEC